MSVGTNVALYVGLGLFFRAGLRPHSRHFLVAFVAIAGSLWWAAWRIR